MRTETSLGVRVRRSGKVAPFVAVCLVGLFSVTAIALDGSLLLADRRQAQSTADAAALAAAIDLFDNWNTNQGSDPNGTAASSAQNTVQDNFPTGTSLTVKKNMAPPYTSLTGDTVVINIPPQSGPNAGQSGYAEVIVIKSQQRFFSSIFGSGNLSASARAVAKGSQAPPGIAILVLGPKSSNTMALTATGNVNASGGTIVVDSSDPAALSLSAAGDVTAGQVRLTGSSYATSASGTVNGVKSPTTNSTILVNQAAVADPLANFAKSNTPTTSPLTTYTNAKVGSFSYSSNTPSANKLLDNNNVQFGTINSPTSVTLYPGFYNGGLTINQNTPGVTFTLSTGVFNFNQNLTFNGYGTVQSGPGGTLLYLSQGSLTNSSQNMIINLAPMTTGTYSNPAIALWSDVNNSSGVNFSSGGGFNLTSGIVYVPNTSSGAVVRFSAKAGATSQLGSQVIVGSLALTGSGNFNVNAGSSSVPGRQLYLVE
jgi:hypothetical protein